MLDDVCRHVQVTCHQARSGQPLLSAAGQGRGPVEIPIAGWAEPPGLLPIYEACPQGLCALVDMDDFLVHSPTLEHHLHDVADVLEMSSKCEFGAWLPCLRPSMAGGYSDTICLAVGQP